jgi:hypothetical protein
VHKLIAIGDIHGRNIWEQIVETEQPNTVVFVGDYFDSFDIPGIDQIHNFKNILHWKQANPQCEVIMLIGNHDFHYMSVCNERYSGFQHSLYLEIGNILETNKHHLQMVYQYDDLLFSHAGISPEWLKKCGWDGRDVVEFINDIWYFQPYKFKFADNGYGHSDPYGDDTYQTPIWIRPKSLMKVLKQHSMKKQYIQVVGHTSVNEIDAKGKATGGRYYFIDVLDNQPQYLVYENKQIKINKL